MDEMTKYQSVEQTSVKKHKQALYGQIRRLGIKCLVPGGLDSTDDSGKAIKDGNSPFRISGSDQNSKIATLQMN